jgi:hypothetical protein
VGRLVLVLIVLLTVLTAVTASAAVLEVDGGVLQVFRLRAEIDVSPLRATVDIKPETLGKKSEGKPVIAFIELPEGHDAGDIEISSVRLCRGTDPCANGVAPGSTPPARVVGGRLRVGFDRAAVLALVADVTPPATLTFTVSGRLSSGRPFSGSDSVMLVSPGGPPEPASDSVETTSSNGPVDTTLPTGDGAMPQPTEPEVTPEPMPSVEEISSVQPSPNGSVNSTTEQPPHPQEAQPAPQEEPVAESTPEPTSESLADSKPEESLPATPEPSPEPNETATP